MTNDIKAVRIAGNLYDIVYPRSRDMDRAVPWNAVENAARVGGYRRIVVDQSRYRGEGEPAAEIVRLDA